MIADEEKISKLFKGKTIISASAGKDSISFTVRGKRSEKSSHITIFMSGDTGADGGWYDFLKISCDGEELGKVL